MRDTKYPGWELRCLPCNRSDAEPYFQFLNRKDNLCKYLYNVHTLPVDYEPEYTSNYFSSCVFVIKGIFLPTFVKNISLYILLNL